MKYIITLLAGILLSITTFAQKEILRTRYNADGTIGFQSYDVTINPKAVTNADEFLRNALSLDTGDITRERWCDSLLRMDMSLVRTGFLLEYSLFSLGSNKYDGTGNDDAILRSIIPKGNSN